MAGRGDIQAGRASVQLWIDKSLFMKGLGAAKQAVTDFGGGLMKIGGLIAGAGAAILGPLAGAVLQFSAMGSEINDLAAKTGFGVEALSEYKFAAEQTGASMEDIGTSAKKMQKLLAEAEGGSKTAAASLANIGLTVNDLKGLAPEEQFQKIADQLATIESPAQRTAAAMEVFGKSGTNLLPMVDNLKALRQEARDLNLVPSAEAISSADDIGDALDKVAAVGKAAVFEIGAALAPVLMPALTMVKNIGAAVVGWIRNNGTLIRTVAAIGLALLVAGGVIAGIGAGFIALGAVIGGVMTVISAVGSAIAFLISPVGMVLVGVAALTAAIAGGAYYWLRFTESGKAALGSLTAFLQPFITTITTAFGGIADALKAGDLQLAGQIAITGLRLIFLQGIEAIAKLFSGKIGDAIGTIGKKIAGGDFKGVWDTAVKGMAAVWDGFVAGIVSAFADAAKKVTDIWAGLTKKVSDSIVEISAKSPAISKMLLGGQDISAIEKRRQELNAAGSKLKTWNGGNDATAAEQIKAGARQGIDADATKIKSALDAVNAAAQAKAAASSEAFNKDIAGGASEASDEVQRLAAELAELRKQAGQAAAAASAPKVAKPGTADSLESIGGGAAAASGSFSAAGLLAMGQGGGVQQQMLVEIKNQKAIQVRQLAETERVRRKIEALDLTGRA